MFQHDHLFNWRTVWKNILIGLEIKKDKDQKKVERVRELLEKYGLIAVSYTHLFLIATTNCNKKQ